MLIFSAAEFRSDPRLYSLSKCKGFLPEIQSRRKIPMLRKSDMMKGAWRWTAF